MTIMECVDLSKQYGARENPVRAVDGISFSIHQGSFTAITGPSGSGKSTLLHLLGGLDRPSGGEVLFQGKNLYAVPFSVRFRRKHRKFRLPSGGYLTAAKYR